jgi:indole-3-glycerol phosphate synthase
MTYVQMDYRIPEDCTGTILETIVRDKLREIRSAAQKWPVTAIKMALDRAPDVRSLRQALLEHAPAIIAEIKKASPSAGLLRTDFDPVQIALQYQEAGAAAISVVTEGKHFNGGLEILAALRWQMDLPLLRKDFVVDPYQLYEARHAGADAVLLIASLLTPSSLKLLCREAEKLGMDALVEIHTEKELEMALASGASLVGVNNRDLRTMSVSLDVSFSLAAKIPNGVLAISESGIKTPEDIRRLSDAGFRGFLIGEQLLRSPSPAGALFELLRGRSSPRRRSS